MHLRIVSPSYFDTMGVSVLDGRAFEEREDMEAPGVVVVNEAFASAHGGRVLGRRLESAAAVIHVGPGVPADYEIVGVVEDERFRGLEQPSVPAVYISTRQFPLTCGGGDGAGPRRGSRPGRPACAAPSAAPSPTPPSAES